MQERYKPESRLHVTPLHKMTLPELEEEYSYRKALLYAFDTDDDEIRSILKSKLNEVREALDYSKR